MLRKRRKRRALRGLDKPKVAPKKEEVKTEEPRVEVDDVEIEIVIEEAEAPEKVSEKPCGCEEGCDTCEPKEVEPVVRKPKSSETKVVGRRGKNISRKPKRRSRTVKE